MVYIKSYRVSGVGHTGAPYTMDLEFNEAQAGNRCHFDPIQGIPMDVAQDLINGWNRTVKMYDKPTEYSLIVPVPEKPVAPQCTSTEETDIIGASLDQAYDMVKAGRWSHSQFEEWCLHLTAEASHSGYMDAKHEWEAKEND